MDNQILSDIASLGELLNLYKVVMLVVGGTILWLLNWLNRRMAQRLMEWFPANRFMILQGATLLTFVVYLGGGGILLAGIVQPPREFLIAIGGSLAVATGIALKDVAASIVAGFLLLFDRPFRVGDRVSFSGVYGQITSIGLRSVRLQTLDDNEVTIPNSRFITEVVSSGNAGALDMMVVCDFHVALDANLALAQQLIREVIVTSRFAYLKKPVSFALSEVVVAERLAICIRAKAYVLDVQYEKAFQSDIVGRATALFLTHDIRRPQR